MVANLLTNDGEKSPYLNNFNSCDDEPCWTGDGRPSKLDLKYAEGVDVYVTETQAELMSISSGVQGVPPFLGRYTVDTHHTPAYAAGYLASKIKPRILMTTHMGFDPDEYYLKKESSLAGRGKPQRE